MLLRRHENYPPPTTPVRLSDLGLYPPSYLFTRNSSSIKARYGIDIGSGPKDGQDDQDLEIEGTDPMAAAQCAILLREELAKYPDPYIKYCGVPRIRFASSLKRPRNGEKNRMYSVGAGFQQTGQSMLFITPTICLMYDVQYITSYYMHRTALGQNTHSQF